VSADQVTALSLSLQVATVGTLLGIVPGIWLGWLLARKSFWGKSVLETVVNLPLVLPPVITGYGLLVLFGRNGPLGAPMEQLLGIQLVFNWKGAALASAIVSFPLLVRSIRLGIEHVDPTLEMAAETLGASRWKAFWHITLPLARSGIVAGCLLAFARGFGEFGATIMIAGNIAGETQTVPLFIYEKLETPGGMNAAGGVIAAAVVVSWVAILLSRRFQNGVITSTPDDHPK